MLVATKEILKPLAAQSGPFSRHGNLAAVFRWFVVVAGRPGSPGSRAHILTAILDVWRAAGGF